MRTEQPWGIQREYTDARGETHAADDNTIAAVLDAMEATEGDPGPGTTIVMRSDTTVPDEVVEVRLEDGVQFPLEDDEPRTLPPGYHLGLDLNGTERPLIVSPGRCWLPDDLRVWGWGVQLYAARSSRSWGMGDLADLRTVGNWGRGLGAEVLLLNPLNAANPGTQQASPYFPSSRRIRNPLYIAIEEVPGAADLEGLDVLVTAGRALNEGAVIDRDAVYELKMSALETLWAVRHPDPDFDAYRERQPPSVEDLATYMTLAERFGTEWSNWPDGYRIPGTTAVMEWRESNQDRIDFHVWLQWLLDRQLESAAGAIGIIHDLPVGIDPSGADAWLWHGVLPAGVTVGAPPDDFSATGQNWGLPPFDPWKLRDAAYRPFVETIRSMLSHGIGLRIDHVMGLFRLWWVPEGLSAADGVYVRYPHEDLLNILALESQRAQSLIVGEDLGTVEDGVREEMAARKMLSYRVLWFEDDLPDSYPRPALAAVTNHDLPTVAGLWTGADIAEQRDLGIEVDDGSVREMRARLQRVTGASEDAAVDEVIELAHRVLATAPSMITIATLDDALGTTRRPNIPGTSEAERANWSIPLPEAIDRLEESELAKHVARGLSSERRLGGP